MISHCTNRYTNLLALSFGLLFIAACSSSDITPGTEVHAHVTHVPAEAPAPAVTTGSSSKLLSYTSGDTIELTAAYLSLSEMELRTDCVAHPFARLLDAVVDLVVPSAIAHTESTPTRLGTPLVVNLLNPDTEEIEFGHFSPAPGSYCGITIHMHAADGDARGLPDSLSMIGLVLYLEGNYNDGSGDLPFIIEMNLELEHADVAFPAAIVLSEASLTGEAHLNIEYNTWFDNIAMADLVAASSSQAKQVAEAQLRENVVHSIHHGHQDHQQ